MLVPCFARAAASPLRLPITVSRPLTRLPRLGFAFSDMRRIYPRPPTHGHGKNAGARFNTSCPRGGLGPAMVYSLSADGLALAWARPVGQGTPAGSCEMGKGNKTRKREVKKPKQD